MQWKQLRSSWIKCIIIFPSKLSENNLLCGGLNRNKYIMSIGIGMSQSLRRRIGTDRTTLVDFECRYRRLFYFLPFSSALRNSLNLFIRFEIGVRVKVNLTQLVKGWSFLGYLLRRINMFFILFLKTVVL